MHILKIVFLFLLVFTFSSCGKKVDHKEVIRELSSDTNSRDVYTSDIIVEEEIVINSSDSKDSKVSKTKGFKEFKARISKFKGGLSHVPWRDRLDKAFIIQSKLLEISNDLDNIVSDYILHSTKVKREKGFIRGNHVFIPYSWNSQQIFEFLKRLEGRPVKKVSTTRGISKKYAKVIKRKSVNKQKYKTDRVILINKAIF